MTKREILADGLLLLTALIWGCAFSVVKNALDSFPPGAIIAMRYLIAAAITGALFHKRLRGLTRGDVARGALVVEVDLRNLLEEGHLAGATLDVFEDEPLPPDHWLWTQPFVNVTPHISAQTVRRDAVVQVALGVRALMRGALPASMVKRSRGY